MRVYVITAICLIIALCLVTVGCSFGQDSGHYEQESSSYDNPKEYNPKRFFDIEPESGHFNYQMYLTQGLAHPTLDEFKPHFDRSSGISVAHIGTEQYSVSLKTPALDCIFIEDDTIYDYFEGITSATYIEDTYEMRMQDSKECEIISIKLFPTTKVAQAYWWSYVYSLPMANLDGFVHSDLGDAGMAGVFTVGCSVRANIVAEAIDRNYLKLIDDQIVSAISENSAE